jgi:hypothetical protein
MKVVILNRVLLVDLFLGVVAVSWQLKTISVSWVGRMI